VAALRYREMLASAPRPPWRMPRQHHEARFAATAQAEVIFSREWRQQATVRDKRTRGYDIEPLG
jgi:hypothetical protein